MSQRHAVKFENVRREHDDVVAALKAFSKRETQGVPGDPGFDPSRLPAAVATAGDAYALLLIATAEGFLRECLMTLGFPTNDSSLGALIDKCRKEFNKRHQNQKIPLRHAVGLHDLRVQRNQYAHGQGPSVFPSIGQIVVTLGRFFHNIP